MAYLVNHANQSTIDHFLKKYSDVDVSAYQDKYHTINICLSPGEKSQLCGAILHLLKMATEETDDSEVNRVPVKTYEKFRIMKKEHDYGNFIDHLDEVPTGIVYFAARAINGLMAAEIFE